MTQNPQQHSFEPPAGPPQQPSGLGQPPSYGQPGAMPSYGQGQTPSYGQGYGAQAGSPWYGQQGLGQPGYGQSSPSPQPQQPPHPQPQPGEQQPWHPADQPFAQEATDAPAGPENVGKGLGFAALGILLGAIASAAIYHFGFLASIVAFGMSVGMVWLYAKGAGSQARKGAMALIALIVVGLVFAWVFTLGSELFFLALDEGATTGEAIGFALGNITDPKLYTVTAKDALFFFGLGVLGLCSTVRQLLAARSA